MLTERLQSTTVLPDIQRDILRWEEVPQHGLPLGFHLQRAKVPDGWLLIIVSPEGHPFDFTFYRDPTHVWTGGPPAASDPYTDVVD